LEEVEVPPVDQCHLDRRTPERVHGLEAAEPAADDDHPMRPVRHGPDDGDPTR
jgi:hypothetical protein